MTKVKRDPTGAKPFTLTLPETAVKNLDFLCEAMGGLKKSQVISYALSLLAEKERNRISKGGGKDDEGIL